MKKFALGLFFLMSLPAVADEPGLEHLFVCTAEENAVVVNVDLQRKGDEHFALYDITESGNLLGSFLAEEIGIAEQVGATSYVTTKISKKAPDGNYQKMDESQFWFSYFDRDVLAGSVFINLKIEGREIELVTKDCR